MNTRYFKGDYIVTHQDEKMISMQVESEWEVPGTSRILYHQHIINWNLEKDNPIYEKTYFIQKDKYDTFKEMVNNKIKEKCESVPDGIGYRFNVSLEDGIIVEKTNTMDPSECYYPTIIIPWNELERILTEEGKSFYQ